METIPAFYFEDRALQALAVQHRDRFLGARPCQHVVVDDFLPVDILERLRQEFPPASDPRWELSGPGRTYFSRDRESAKLAMRSDVHAPPFIRHLLGQLNSSVFLRFLETLTGATGLIVDPTFNGCGLHSTGRGGRLMLHTDMNRHPHFTGTVHQILNAILYLNPGWKDEYGGHLELWDKSPRRCVTRIAPIANRLVIFNTGTGALHGHPDPVGGPEGLRRNSLAVYYYTLDRPADADYDHFQIDVNWHATSDDDLRFATDTLARFRGALAERKGRPAPFAAHNLPGVIASLVPFGDRRTVFLFDWDEVGEPARFIDSHLRAFAALTPDALGAVRPFGLIGVTDERELFRPDAITCLHDEEGRIFFCPGPDAPRLVWAGFVGRFLKLLS